jgi:hypothetical protein
MRKIVIVLTLCAAACSGGDADTTVISDTTVTTAPATTTTTPATSTTTSTSTSTSTSTTSTTTTTLLAGFTAYTHELFTLSYPGTWTENPEFPGFGVGFVEDHIALALPSTRFEIYLEQQEAGFDLDAHIQRLQDDLALFVPDFRVLRSGDQLIDGVRSLWFEYAEEFDGFPIVIREQAALRGDLLTTFTLISPVEFFEFDQGPAAAVVESFRFS